MYLRTKKRPFSVFSYLQEALEVVIMLRISKFYIAEQRGSDKPCITSQKDQTKTH